MRKNNIMKEKIKGFIITYEVMITLVTMTLLLGMIIHSLSTLNTQRFMNTVLANTLITVAKFGGKNSNMAKVNNIGNIETTANAELQRVAGKFNPVLTVGPDKITEGNPNVFCNLEFTYPKIIPGMLHERRVKLHVEMESIAQAGLLLQ